MKDQATEIKAPIASTGNLPNLILQSLALALSTADHKFSELPAGKQRELSRGMIAWLEQLDDAYRNTTGPGGGHAAVTATGSPSGNRPGGCF
jgi:hypothetical protein